MTNTEEERDILFRLLCCWYWIKMFYSSYVRELFKFWNNECRGRERERESESESEREREWERKRESESERERERHSANDTCCRNCHRRFAADIAISFAETLLGIELQGLNLSGLGISRWFTHITVKSILTCSCLFKPIQCLKNVLALFAELESDFSYLSFSLFTTHKKANYF